MNKQCESIIDRRHGEAAGNTSHDMTLRVKNLKPMKLFYQHVLGFELLGEFPSAALLRVGDGSGAQDQMLGLVQRSDWVGPERNGVAHITFITPVRDREFESKRLESLGFRVDAMNHDEIGERSLCFRDPEGNQVELLCCDPRFDS